MVDDEFFLNAIRDRFEGWELVEFLDIPIDDVISAALDGDWFTAKAVRELKEFLGISVDLEDEDNYDD